MITENNVSKEFTTSITNFSKYLIMMDNQYIKSFIHNFKGGKGDEEDFQELMFKIDSNRLGIPVQIQDKIDYFIYEYLEPMVYDKKHIFPKHETIGRIQNGVRHIDTQNELQELLDEYFEVLIETENSWDIFAMEELHPYLML